MLLYKYRDLKNFRFFVDIILHKRLHAGSYLDMNDPMEGDYLHYAGELDKQMIDSIKGRKQSLKICSLSKELDVALMWAHYADGGRGVVVEVEVDQVNTQTKPIKYTREPITVESRRLGYQTPIEILSTKRDVWKHEKEVRVFVENGTSFVPVIVKRVITGQVMSEEDHWFVKRTVEKLDPLVVVQTIDSYRLSRSRQP